MCSFHLVTVVEKCCISAESFQGYCCRRISTDLKALGVVLQSVGNLAKHIETQDVGCLLSPLIMPLSVKQFGFKAP